MYYLNGKTFSALDGTPDLPPLITVGSIARDASGGREMLGTPV